MTRSESSRQVEEIPFLLIENLKVTVVSKEFCTFVGFSIAELIGKTITEISSLLRCNRSLEGATVENSTPVYIFTKYHEPMEITVKIEQISNEGIIYIIREVPQSNIQEELPMFEQLFREDEKGMAIYSAEDKVLLKANSSYYNLLEKPYNVEETVGRRVSAFISEDSRSELEQLWLDAVETGKSKHVDEFLFQHFERGDIYCERSLIPIFKRGQLRYVIEMIKDITDKVKQRNIVEEQTKVIGCQNMQLEALFESIKDIICLIDKKGNYIHLYSAFKDIFKDEKIINVKDLFRHSEFHYLDGKKLSLDEFPTSRILRGETFKSLKLVVKKAETEAYFDFTGTPVFDEIGNFETGIMIIQDITQDLQKSRVIENQKEELKAILANSSDGLIMLDTRRNITFLNDAVKKFLDQPHLINNTEDVYREVTLYDINGNIITSERLPSVKALKGETTIGMRVTAKAPHRTYHFNISASPIYNKEKELTGALLSIRHLDEVIKYEKMLKEKRDNLYNIIDNLQLPIWRISYPDFKIVQFNKRTVEDLDGTDIFRDIDISSIKAGDNVLALLPKALIKEVKSIISKIEKTKSAIYFTNYKVVKNSKIYYKNFIYQPMMNSNNEIVEILIISIDITNEVQQRKELERILKMKEEFFSFISHEFKTPLTVMSSIVQLIKLLFKNDLPEKAMKYIDKLNLSTLQQLRLVNNLLDITRSDSGYLKINKKNSDIVFMTRVIADSVKNFAVRKNVNIYFQSDIHELIIGIDDEKYERIILNLLSNAIKFTPSEKSIFISLTQNHNKVLIRIRDEGVGIPEDKLDVIFERFGQVNSSLTRQGEGTGIGLSLVKVLVEGLKGDVRVKSKVGEGTTFTLELPITTINEYTEDLTGESLDDRLVQSMDIEFSNIYFE